MEHGVVFSPCYLFLTRAFPFPNSVYNYWPYHWALRVSAIHLLFTEDHQRHYWVEVQNTLLLHIVSIAQHQQLLESSASARGLTPKQEIASETPTSLLSTHHPSFYQIKTKLLGRTWHRQHHLWNISSFLEQVTPQELWAGTMVSLT